jgi:hypothetical protein
MREHYVDFDEPFIFVLHIDADIEKSILEHVLVIGCTPQNKTWRAAKRFDACDVSVLSFDCRVQSARRLPVIRQSPPTLREVPVLGICDFRYEPSSLKLFENSQGLMSRATQSIRDILDSSRLSNIPTYARARCMLGSGKPAIISVASNCSSVGVFTGLFWL